MSTAKNGVTYYIGIGQLNTELDLEPLRVELNDYYKDLSKKLNTEDLQDWILTLKLVLGVTDAIGVAKRATRYPSDKEAEVSLVIPIPNPEQAEYGSPNASDPNYSTYRPLAERNFHFLDPDYAKYRSLADYVRQSAMRAMDELFRLGTSVNGKKIKLKK